MQNLCIQKATTKDIPAIKSIWQECFTTDESYLHNVFTYLLPLSQVYICRNNIPTDCSKTCVCPATSTSCPILSTLFLIPITYKSATKEILHGQYLYGVATTAEARGQKLSIKMVENLSAMLKLHGEDFIITRPAEEKLFDFYRAQGFVMEISRRDFSLPPALVKALSHANPNNTLFPEASLLFNYIARTYPTRFEWSPALLNYMIRIGEFNRFFAPDSIYTASSHVAFALVKTLNANGPANICNNSFFNFPME